METLSNSTLSRVQDISTASGFPPHIHDLLNKGGTIHFPEIFCRLVHVCMIEVGFIPLLNEGHVYSVEEFLQLELKESIQRFTKDLKFIVSNSGSVHSVAYKAVVFKEEIIALSFQPPTQAEEDKVNLEVPDGSMSQEKATLADGGGSSSVPVGTKESGDGSLSGGQISLSSEDSFETTPQEMRQIKELSNDITVIITHDGYDMHVVACGQGIHKNMQLSVSKYIRFVHPMQQLPTAAKAEEYLRLINFEACRFADDIKRNFCYPIMDDLNGLSFDVRSLAWMPAEIIVEVAKRCSPLSVFRLRATCSEIRNALSSTNQQFWMKLLKRDFPQCRIEQLRTDSSEDKYFRKYSEMCNLTIRRPLRRTVGRIFPFYLLSNFRV